MGPAYRDAKSPRAVPLTLKTFVRGGGRRGATGCPLSRPFLRSRRRRDQRLFLRRSPVAIAKPAPTRHRAKRGGRGRSERGNSRGKPRLEPGRVDGAGRATSKLREADQTGLAGTDSPVLKSRGSHRVDADRKRRIGRATRRGVDGAATLRWRNEARVQSWALRASRQPGRVPGPSVARATARTAT
jgi:hypothetical protein